MNTKILGAERAKLLIWRVIFFVLALLVLTRCVYLFLRISAEWNLFTHM